MSDERIWTAAVLVIGDEILSGRTQDKNVSQIATWLDVQGIRLREVRIVPDVEGEIVDALNAIRARYDYVFTTGGIGPTHDDITADAVGAAFGVAILGIYVLVVGQFRSFTLPLVILTPIPLTLVGIVLGHMLFRAPFTATSMIGFIALAGIIVRNSILLVDFIRHTRSPDKSLRETLLEAGTIRFKPIVLTAAAAMIGAAVILTDPIFQGLAISLLFGLASSTLLTVLVIPAIYIVLRDDGRPLTDHPQP